MITMDEEKLFTKSPSCCTILHHLSLMSVTFFRSLSFFLSSFFLYLLPSCQEEEEEQQQQQYSGPQPCAACNIEIWQKVLGNMSLVESD